MVNGPIRFLNFFKSNGNYLLDFFSMAMEIDSISHFFFFFKFKRVLEGLNIAPPTLNTLSIPTLEADTVNKALAYAASSGHLWRYFFRKFTVLQFLS